MVTKIKSRNITRTVERELWARAGGRCEFDGCNLLLYLSPMTSEHQNIAEKAHIYSFSDKGPRGWGPFRARPEELNHPRNLMLLCNHCHGLVDKNMEKYSAELLIRWKEAHEYRVYTVTGISPKKASQVVLYGANIGDENSSLQPEVAKQSIFPDRYPADERVIQLSMSWEGRDEQSNYWATEEDNLKKNFEQLLRPRIKGGVHFSVFALAPMPLLIRLGSLLTDKVATATYQFIREPEPTWAWDDDSPEVDFVINSPKKIAGLPALIISLSAKIDHDRVRAVLGVEASIWELTVSEPHNDFLRAKHHLSSFRAAAREVIAAILAAHGNSNPLAVFPAMPVSAAVEFGRIRMPKADMPWDIYDQNAKHKPFIQDTHDWRLIHDQ